MKVLVGSLNKAKIMGVEEAFTRYFDEIVIKPIKVDSGVAPQPMSLSEVIKGSKTRAVKAAEKEREWMFSVGIEAGIYKANDAWMDVQVAYIIRRDGMKSMGMSPAFPVPRHFVDKLLNQEYDELEDIINEQYARDNIGEEEGFIGILTKNIVDRKTLTYYAVVMALTPFLNEDLYR